MKTYIYIFLTLILSACGAFGDDGIQKTVEANDAYIATEAFTLNEMANDDQTAVALTVVSANTEIARIDSVNDQLYLTLAAGSTPTIAVVRGIADPSSSGDAMDDMSAETTIGDSRQQLIKTGVSDRVDLSNGCVVSPRQSFPSTVTELYATMLAINVEAGTFLQAEWYYEGVLRVSQTWSVDITSPQRCLWFNIDLNDTELTPGAWTVILYAGAPIGEPDNFIITQE